ncbi:hypothetical protein ABGB12_10130 [Actinocorallia sp. B10E7]|uniref:hypothetical protein n=1 Tax=Actinocorallia sp. B10E7 TaxID=3153558 RepID=UPI00325DE55A
MTDIVYSGELTVLSDETLQDVLTNWVRAPLFPSARFRRGEREHEGEDLSLHLRLEESPGTLSREQRWSGAVRYLLSGAVKASVSEAEERLRALGAACSEVAIVCRLEYRTPGETDAREIPVPRPKIAYSVRIRTRQGRSYYSNVYAYSLEEAYARHGTSGFEGAEIDIVQARADDLERAERGLSYP